MSNVYIISGPDASGKSTQIRRLQNTIEKEHEVHTVWLRHKHFLSLIPLLFSRIIGCTINEEVNEYSYQYHRFSEHRVLGYVYTLLLFVDLYITYIVLVYFPSQRGKVVICDRGPLDTLIDLRFKLDLDYKNSILERAFMCLPPKDSKTIVFYAKPNELKKRRERLQFERDFDKRVHLYHEEAERLGLKKIDTSYGEDFVFKKTIRYLFE